MQYIKTAEGKWIFDEIEDKSATLSLSTVAFNFTVSDVYEQVDFVYSDEE
jgi:hypothetical protein